MDYTDEQLLKECEAIAQPYIDKMNADPLSDHHTLHKEMRSRF